MKIEEHRVITLFKKELEEKNAFKEASRENNTVIFKRTQTTIREEASIVFRLPSTMIIRIKDSFGDEELAFKGRIPESLELLSSLLYLTRVN